MYLILGHEIPSFGSLERTNVAPFHAAVGESDKAFAELNKAYQHREGILGLLKVDPRFDSLHDDPRFEELVRRFKIAPSDVLALI